MRATRKAPVASLSSTPAFSHVFIIALENAEYSAIVGNPAAPFINPLAQRYGLATQYYAVTHPSPPNYLALTGGDTFDITSDCHRCFVDAPNIADQVEASGRTWRAYMESMPSPCFIGDQGDYAQKHNPFVYYDDIRANTARCEAHVVPFTQFAADLSSNSMPNYAWITPQLCMSLHSCGVSAADSWLSQVVPGILSSTAFTNSGVLFLVWDEGSSDSGCCDEAEGGRIPALVISPLAKNGFQSTTQETHYSLLRTIGDAWGLPRLGMAGQNPPLTEYFSQIRPAADSSLDSSRSPALEPLPSASVPLRGGRYDLGEPGRLFGRAPRDQGRDASTGAHADQSLGDGFSVSLRGR